MTTPSPFVSAIAHTLAALHELIAASDALGDEDHECARRLFDAGQYAVIARDALRVRYEATQETVPERTCDCGQPLCLGRCVRCWARRELGVRT